MRPYFFAHSTRCKKKRAWRGSGRGKVLYLKRKQTNMVTNLHFLRINSNYLPENLARQIQRKAQAHTMEGIFIIYVFPECPIIEQKSLKNLGISYTYTHKQFIQLSLF